MLSKGTGVDESCTSSDKENMGKGYRSLLYGFIASRIERDRSGILASHHQRLHYRIPSLVTARANPTAFRLTTGKLFLESSWSPCHRFRSLLDSFQVSQPLLARLYWLLVWISVFSLLPLHTIGQFGFPAIVQFPPLGLPESYASSLNATLGPLPLPKLFKMPTVSQTKPYLFWSLIVLVSVLSRL